jgi:hypothetical protein
MLYVAALGFGPERFPDGRSAVAPTRARRGARPRAAFAALNVAEAEVRSMSVDLQGRDVCASFARGDRGPNRVTLRIAMRSTTRATPSVGWSSPPRS